MQKRFFNTPVVLTLIACALLFSLAGWNSDTTGRHEQTNRDTTPFKKGDLKIVDLDEALTEIDRGLAEMETSLKKQNREKMQKELQQLMQDIQVSKEEVQRELKNFNTEKIKMEMEKTIKEMDAQKLKKEIQESMANINREKMKKELEALKTTELPKIQAEMKKIKPEIEKALKEAKEKAVKAKKEIVEWKRFVDGLENDSLLTQKKGYIIIHENGQLKINGKTQPESVYNKYRTFLEKHKKFTLKKKEGNFTMDMD